MFALAGGELEGFSESNALWDGFIDERVHGSSAGGFQHLIAFGWVRTNMTSGEGLEVKDHSIITF